MPDKKQIETLKELFTVAKNAPRDNEGWFEDLALHRTIRGTLIDIGKEKIYELADEIYQYLNDPCSEFRAEAVRTLGWNTRLGINEFCENQAYQIWEQDPDEEVKRAALSSWGGYYSETKDSNVMKKIYEILVSEEYSCEVRTLALRLLLDVSSSLIMPEDNYLIFDLNKIKDHDEFDKAVDWKRVNRIMKECIPGWNEKK